jgi:hypothetical protein
MRLLRDFDEKLLMTHLSEIFILKTNGLWLVMLDNGAVVGSGIQVKVKSTAVNSLDDISACKL